jgi:hypothetical protein
MCVTARIILCFCSKKNHMYGNKFVCCPLTIHRHTMVVAIQWSYSRYIFSIHVHRGIINKWTLVDIVLYNPVERNTMSTTHNMGGRSVQWRKKEWRRISSSFSLSIFHYFLDGFFYHILSQQNWTIGRCFTVHFCAHRLSSSSSSPLLLLLLLLFNFVFMDCFVTYFCVFRKVSVKMSHFAYTHTRTHTNTKENNPKMASKLVTEISTLELSIVVILVDIDSCFILRLEIVGTLYSASMQRWLSSTGEENGVLVVAGPGLWNTRKYR